jgi:hypothetical protein
MMLVEKEVEGVVLVLVKMTMDDEHEKDDHVDVMMKAIADVGATSAAAVHRQRPSTEQSKPTGSRADSGRRQEERGKRDGAREEGGGREEGERQRKRVGGRKSQTSEP